MNNNNVHDRSYKDLFSNKDVFINLIRGYVSNTWGNEISENNLSLIDKSFILEDYEQIESDIVYKASIDNHDIIFYILLEFQSSVDYSMPIRLFFYMSSIWREIVKNTEKNEFRRKDFKLPAIIPIVLYNGKERWTAAKSLKEKISSIDKFDDNIVDFNYILLDVNRYSREELISKGDISSAIFLLDQNSEIYELLNRIRDIVLHFYNLSDRDINLIKHWLRNTIDEEIVKDIENLLSVDKSEVDIMTSNVSKSISEHFEKAKQEGSKAKEKDVILNLYNMGIDLETISKAVCLSIAEVEDIIKNLRH